MLSPHAAKRLTREWDIWHRFKEFDTLDARLRKKLGFQMKLIVLPPRKTMQNIFSKKMDAAFLEERRTGLDSYVQQVTVCTSVCVAIILCIFS